MKRFILLIVMCLAITTVMFGQTLKIAYLDTSRIMEESQATKDAQQLFSAESEQWYRQIDDMEKEIQRLQTEFETRKLTLTETGRNQAQERIDAKILERRRFIESIFGETGKAMQRNAELLEPIMIKLKESIEKIAIDNNYSIIFDAVEGGILYAKPNLDITDLVLEDLNRAAGN